MDLAAIEGALRSVLERRADVRFAYLFGSTVTRDPATARDVDVAVSFTVSPSLFAVGELATSLEGVLGREVDVVDLDDATTLLRWEVVRSGRVLMAPDPRALAEFRARVPLEYLELKPHLERQAAGLRRVLRERAWSVSTS
ncbi:MAG: hypothetical protein IPK07_21160 [Deltaproteobacteria bacterium]|nr:hypothetical protein [Deltaproteobacteria bacterium]